VYFFSSRCQAAINTGMAISGVPLIILQTVTTVLFRAARLIFTVVQGLWWRVNGTAQLLAESRLPENYERSAHLLDIVVRHKFDILQAFSVRDFICVHNRFVSPSYVLANDSVSLFTVNETDAVFIEAREAGMQLWKSRYNPFIKNAQMEYGHRLIVIPLAAFHRMSEELGDPKGKLILLFNTGRCGSTLLTQLFEHTGLAVTISEPDTLTILAVRYRNQGDSEQLRQLVQNVMRWTCRPYKEFEPVAYLIKLSSISSCAMHFFAELYPNSPFLFMYRDALKLAESCYRVSRYLPSLHLLYILGKFSAYFGKLSADAIGFAGRDFNVKLYDDLSFGIWIFIRTATPYLELYSKGFKTAAVRYEDLIANPLAVSQRLLEFCGLPKDRASSGLKCMEIDSQRNTPVAQNLQRQYSNPVLTPDSKSVANQLLLKHGLPIIGEDCLLDGTIGRV
jgi:hypothetical protein